MKRVTLLPEGEEQLLDRYQLVGEIASGGMATVFLARLAGVGGFQRFVAIKRLHAHMAGEEQFVEMFLDEARLAASIHHQNVVPILEIGVNDGAYYTVMEYIEGVTLARLMSHAVRSGNPVPRPTLVRIVLDTLRGLHASHELTDDHGEPLHLVHRDCTPQNILVGLDGNTRITDFGIARAASRLANTREGAMKGKLAYMAPEQTQGEDIDRRADLFSVAVVLWEVLCAKRLFKGSSEAETLRRLLVERVPKPSEVVKTLHLSLDAFLIKALQRDPDLRYQTAEEMARDLERAAREAGGDDGIASHREVEAYMKSLYGKDFVAQREAVRSYLEATPSTLEVPSTDLISSRSSAPRASVDPLEEVTQIADDRTSVRGGALALDDASDGLYQRSSTTGVTAGASEPTETTLASPGRRSGGSARVGLVVALIAAAGVGGYALAGRGGSGSGSGATPPASNAAPSSGRDVQPAPSTAQGQGGEAAGPAASGSAAASGLPSASAPPPLAPMPWPTARRPLPSGAAAPVTSAPPPVPASSAPAPPPAPSVAAPVPSVAPAPQPPPPALDEDLSNPYR